LEHPAANEAAVGNATGPDLLGTFCPGGNHRIHGNLGGGGRGGNLIAGAAGQSECCGKKE
jgi:hypothetical protein